MSEETRWQIEKMMYFALKISTRRLMLMGRVNALAGIIQASKYFVDREVVAAALGFELAENKDNEQGGKAE